MFSIFHSPPGCRSRCFTATLHGTFSDTDMHLWGKTLTCSVCEAKLCFIRRFKILGVHLRCLLSKRTSHDTMWLRLFARAATDSLLLKYPSTNVCLSRDDAWQNTLQSECFAPSHSLFALKTIFDICILANKFIAPTHTTTTTSTRYEMANTFPGLLPFSRRHPKHV